MTRPWDNFVCDPDDAWDAYGNWEAWVRSKLPECFHDEWEDCPGGLQANLYGIMADLADARPAARPGSAKIDRYLPPIPSTVMQAGEDAT